MSKAEEILFGSDHTPGIVAIDIYDHGVRVYRRNGDKITYENEPFRPWLLTTQKYELAGAEWTELDGDGFKFLASFPDQRHYKDARDKLRESHSMILSLPTLARQYLTISGRTLFKEMAFDDIHRMQLDIETNALRPKDAQAEILLIGITDNRGFETAISGSERDILTKLIEIVREIDPDAIEGHNLFGFDFPYLMTRAEMLGISLDLGRDGSPVRAGSRQRCAIGYYDVPFQPVHINGRHVIDTLLAVQRWDVSKATLTSHALKSVAQALGIAEDHRELIPPNAIATEWQTNPERVTRYCLQDVRETRSLAEIVCPPDFYLTQMVPDTYSHTATSGNGEKINSLFIREYLRQGKAIPLPMEPKPLPGGYTEVLLTGVIERIVKCDVESLYPSIMLTHNIKPASDTLGIFLPALAELTRRRIEAKRMARQSQGRNAAYWDGLQSAFKIIINSFYGYLAGQFNFNDYIAAAKVTTTGQRLIKEIVAALEREGSRVIEVDTDGVYFQPPANIDSEQKEIAYVDRIGTALPEGIRLTHDGRYQAMISLKVKNYVLSSYDGKITFRGSSLRSRADERFGREFIGKAAELLLMGKPEAVAELYQELAEKIRSGALTIDDFARRERVTEKTFTSVSKKRMAQAIGNIPIGDYVTIYERRDGTVGLADDYANDENRDYLLEKLYKFACRLREAIGERFDELFPRPLTARARQVEGQQTLGLFD